MAFCNEAKYADKADFAKSLAECFKGMTVEDLCGYTKEELMAFVERKGGPDGLVPAWLEKHGLDGYLKSADTKKAKTRSSSSSPSKEMPELFDSIKGRDVSKANALVKPPVGDQWLCGMDKHQALFVRECYAWFYDEALKKKREAGCPGVIYTGNPGIGKSAWLNYALVRFLQDDYVVVLERAQESDYLVFREGSCVRQKHSRPVLDDLPDKAVYLFDPDESNSCPLKSNVFTIIASSPQEPKH